MAPKGPFSFVADCTLGKLTKYLRLAGFDTLLDQRAPDAGRLMALAGNARIVLTRSHRVKGALAGQRVLFIVSNAPQAQLDQVVAELGLQLQDVHPLSRCALCNQKLEPISRDRVFDRVPEYVWRHQPCFRTCSRCARVYWQGTHAQRWLERMAASFHEH